MEKQAKRKPATPSPPLPTKYLWQSSSEFPIRDRKGKGKAKSLSDEDKEIKGLINDAMGQIIGALHIKDTPKGLDYVISQGLAGDNWIDNPPPADEHYWFQGFTAHKPMPSSSQIKALGPKVETIEKKFEVNFHGFHRGKIHDCFHGTSAKEDRIAANVKKACGESFIVKIEKYGNVEIILLHVKLVLRWLTKLEIAKAEPALVFILAQLSGAINWLMHQPSSSGWSQWLWSAKCPLKHS